MMRNFLLSFTVSKIFRQGIRTRERGKTAHDGNWSLLEMALGEEVEKINPLIRAFYANPSRFDVTATLKLETLPARFWSRFLTFLFGQGLYETDLQEIPDAFPHFRAQRRLDALCPRTFLQRQISDFRLKFRCQKRENSTKFLPI